MWNYKKSTVCSLVCTRIVMVLMIVSAVFLPKLMSILESTAKVNMDKSGFLVMMVVLYLCLIPGAVALFSLDRLLVNILGDEVFIRENVSYLRKISWACFVASLLLAYAGIYYILLIVMAILAAFIGLILRVVKNVIEEAVVIKCENDYTI